MPPHVVNEISCYIQNVKQKEAMLFGDLDIMNLLTFKSHMPNQIPKDFPRYGDISVLDAYCFEPSNFTVRKFIRTTSIGKETTFAKAVAAMNCTQGVEEALLCHVDPFSR